MSTSKSFNTQKMVILALLTAIVIVLQFLGAFIRFGPFSISLVLLPIVVGAALVNTWGGGWLGFVFGAVVLISGDANVFLAIDPVATILVVILKGTLAGLAAGFFYRLFSKINRTVGAVTAAVVCPVVNTGVFIVGLYVFFLPTITEWGIAAGFESIAAFIFIGMIGLNVLIELGLNVILSPTIVRLIQYAQGGLTERSGDLVDHPDDS